MFRRFLAAVRDFWVAPDPAEAGPVPDDWPPPEQVTHFPRREVLRTGVCDGCGQVVVPSVPHDCWGDWEGMK